MKYPTLRLKYYVRGFIGIQDHIKAWEEDGKIYYSWYDIDCKPREGGGISDISLEELNSRIDSLGADQSIKKKPSIYCSPFCLLKLRDSKGNKIRYEWNGGEDVLSDDLNDFIAFIADIITDAPTKLKESFAWYHRTDRQ